MSYRCPRCHFYNPIDDFVCGGCGGPPPQPAIRSSAVSVQTLGNQAALLEEITTRQYDERGILRNELIERRAWVAPATAVPATNLRAYSSQSFAPYQQPAQLGSGSPITNDGLKRLLEEFDLLDKER